MISERMERYENAYVYGIWFRNQLLYVGSSCSPLNKRKYQHKNYTTHLGKKCCPVHYWIAENVPDMWDNFELRIEEIAKVPCKDKQELRRAEGEHIRRLNPSCNKVIAGRTGKEWKKDNKDKLKEQRKNYYEANKEKEALRYKIYAEANKERLSAYKKAWYEAQKLKNKTLP